MKKFLCAILFLTMVISLSACGGKGVSTLVKHYGQEKVDEMEIECTDETQLKVANDLIAEAKDIMSYCGSGDGTNKEDCGALERGCRTLSYQYPAWASAVSRIHG